MPIFSKSKSASLNPDKLANKKVYERDKARVSSGTPSASSKVDADTFSSLIDTLEELKNELIKVQNVFDTQQDKSKFEYGSILNVFSKATKQIRSISSNSITSTEQFKLQEYTDTLTTFYNQIDTIQGGINITMNDLLQNRARYTVEEFDKKEKFARNLLLFYKNIVIPFKTLLALLNTKLVSTGNDANPNVPLEISGINAPVPYNDFTGAGFKTSWRLEKGAEQYQNQKYI